MFPTRKKSSIADTSFQSKLVKLKLIGKDFSQIQVSQIRKFLRNHVSSLQKMMLMFSFMAENMRVPEQMLKILCVAQLITQDALFSKSSTFIDFLVSEVNEIYKCANKFSSRKTFVESKDTSSCRKKKSNIVNNFMRMVSLSNSVQLASQRTEDNCEKADEPLNLCEAYRIATEITQQKHAKKQKSKIMQKFFPDVMTKDQVICQNLVVPFANYLLRHLSNITNSHIEGKLRLHHLWPIFNSFFSMFKISKHFNNIVRYYSKDLLDGVLFIIRILDQQIHNLYPLVTCLVRDRISQLKPQLQLIKQNSEFDKEHKRYLFECFKVDYQLQNFKQIINEIYNINEGIMGLYYGRQFARFVKQQKLYPPNLLKDTALDIDFLFKICKNDKQLEKGKLKKGYSLNISKTRLFEKEILLRVSSEKISIITQSQQSSKVPFFGFQQTLIMKEENHSTKENELSPQAM